MATKNIVPRADGQGMLGTTEKQWLNTYTGSLNEDIDLKNNYSLCFRKPSREYELGEFAFHADLPAGMFLKCTTAGQTSSGELTISSSVNLNDELTDGTVTWEVGKITNIEEVSDIINSGLETRITALENAMNNKLNNNTDETLDGSLTVTGVTTGDIYLPTEDNGGNIWIESTEEKNLLKLTDDFYRMSDVLAEKNVLEFLSDIKFPLKVFSAKDSNDIISVDGFDTSELTKMFAMFYNCKEAVEIDISKFNTSNITDMQIMFNNCNQLISLDLSNWNTSNVLNMKGMFEYCESLVDLDISNFNTDKVTNMERMFTNCNSLKSLNVSNWNTNNVFNMNSIFANCKSLTSLDVSNFNTANVTDMYNMFCGCEGLTSLDVSSFNTDKVTSMGGMFFCCNKLTNLNLSNFNTSNVTNMQKMFTNCSSLINLILNFDMSKITNKEKVQNMLFGCHPKMGSIVFNNVSSSVFKDEIDFLYTICSSVNSDMITVNFA